MNEIVITNTNGQLTVSSLQVAESFEKRHDNIIRDIEGLLNFEETEVSEKMADLFNEKIYQHPQNKQLYKYYEMTRDGFSLLVMGFTGKKALNWKLKYIEAFNAMEQAIRGQQKQLDALLIQAKADRATAMRLNAENRRLKLLFDNPQWKDMQLSGIGIETLGLKKLEEITGIDMGNALPQTERTWSATELGKDFGVSAQAIGKKANALGIKTPEYGITVMDKSRYSNKEVTTFRYNKKGYDTLARAFGIS